MGKDSLALYGSSVRAPPESSFLNCIRLRPYRRTDVNVIQELFDISFPIHYDDCLYEAMAQKVYQDRELVSLVAEYVFEVYLRIVG